MKIKLIIWDLDETFWNGSIENNNVKVLNKNINYIKKLTECGIVNSICSHNKLEKAKKILEQNKINDYFIFPKINNKPKGSQVLKIIKQTNFREQNVLFIDDKLLNLKEVKYYCPNINILNIKDNNLDAVINQIIQSGEKKSRLEYYKILEKKYKEIENNNISNEDFLKLSNISVYIETFKKEHFDRVFELINRTNQLNFTKNKCLKDDLKKYLNCNSYVIYVYDKFGEYGLSGFVSFDNTKVNHFLFSCRVLNMGIESFIFKYLNIPSFEISGEISGNLNIKSNWVKIKKINSKHKILNKNKILFIGGCDLEQAIHYIKNKNIDSYFNYIDKRNPKNIIHRDSIDFILNNLTEEQKKFIIDTCPFVDGNVFNVPNFLNYSIVVYSPLIDYIQGKYKSPKIPNYYLSCNPFLSEDLTEKRIIEMFNDRGITKKDQLKFKNNWSFCIKSDNSYYNQLFKLFEKLNNNKVIVLLGATNTYSDLDKDKFYIHKNNNTIIKKAADNFNNIILLDVNKFINSRNNFTNSIRHYSRDVYYKIAEEINNYLR